MIVLEYPWIQDIPNAQFQTCIADDTVQKVLDLDALPLAEVIPGPTQHIEALIIVAGADQGDPFEDIPDIPVLRLALPAVANPYQSLLILTRRRGSKVPGARANTKLWGLSFKPRRIERIAFLCLE